MTERNFYARMARLSAIVVILPSSMAGGWVLGYYAVDQLLGSFPWGSLTMTMLGAGAGFYQIFKILLQDQRGGNGS